jgi:hypothetical protein
MQRADIPEGVLQVIDLVPNNSTKNNILEPAEGQSGYVRQPSNEACGTTNPAASQEITSNTFTGLSVYLLDNIEDSGGAAITAVQANDAATAIIALVRAGSVVDETAVDAELITAGATAGTGLTAGASTGTIQDVLLILSGRSYVVPEGAEMQDAGGSFSAVRKGAFDTTEPFVPLLATGALNVSVGGGKLFGYLRTDFLYEGPLTASVGPADGLGAAVVVYNDDGTLFTV